MKRTKSRPIYNIQVLLDSLIEKNRKLKMRDDFSLSTKETLAKRVNFLCSNSGCGHPTSGPQEDPTKTINIGVAAHITAASHGGPRFDPSLTPEQRKHVSNGIWLCQRCAKLIDSDEARYTDEKIRQWKESAEFKAAKALENGSKVRGTGIW